MKTSPKLTPNDGKTDVGYNGGYWAGAAIRYIRENYEKYKVDLLCRLFEYTLNVMVRGVFIAIILLLLHSKAYACSCSARGVIPISDMLGSYDFVFMAQVDNAIDLNNNNWPLSWYENFDFEKYKTLEIKPTPTKRAKITITEVFKGSLKGSVDLIFKPDPSNCAGGYYSPGEKTLFFLQDLGDGFVRATGACSISNLYSYSKDQIREFTRNGTNPNLLGVGCELEFSTAESFAVFLGKKPIALVRPNCAAYYEDYKAGKFLTSTERGQK